MSEKVFCYTDEYTIRLNALQVFLMTLGVITFQSILLISLLIVDFGLRVFTKLPTPLVINSMFVLKFFSKKAKPVFNPSKRFASLMGFLLALSLPILLMLNSYIAFYAVVGFLSMCTFLEAFFKVCVGGYIYSFGAFFFPRLIRK